MKFDHKLNGLIAFKTCSIKGHAQFGHLKSFPCTSS